MWDLIAHAISTATEKKFILSEQSPVGGGCINDAYRLEGAGTVYFVKINDASRQEMFQAESDALLEIASSNTVRVPRPICHGTAKHASFLVLEHIPVGPSLKKTQQLLGLQLARMHKKTNPLFGWHRDNTIGSTPQINTSHENWVEFWRQNRLAFQFRLAAKPGKRFRDEQALYEKLPDFFADYQPKASLLHGDLWGGNASADETGQPIVFDPATYYGDRETDLAFTECFGGFTRDFYAAYQSEYPLNEGYKKRSVLYNLYHILNHFNLFGGSYASQAEHMIAQLLRCSS